MAVVMVEDFGDIPANSPVTGECLIMQAPTLELNNIVAEAWQELCPIYDSLTPDQL